METFSVRTWKFIVLRHLTFFNTPQRVPHKSREGCGDCNLNFFPLIGNLNEYSFCTSSASVILIPPSFQVHGHNQLPAPGTMNTVSTLSAPFYLPKGPKVWITLLWKKEEHFALVFFFFSKASGRRESEVMSKGLVHTQGTTSRVPW